MFFNKLFSVYILFHCIFFTFLFIQFSHGGVLRGRSFCHRPRWIEKTQERIALTQKIPRYQIDSKISSKEIDQESPFSSFAEGVSSTAKVIGKTIGYLFHKISESKLEGFQNSSKSEYITQKPLYENDSQELSYIVEAEYEIRKHYTSKYETCFPHRFTQRGYALKDLKRISRRIYIVSDDVKNIFHERGLDSERLLHFSGTHLQHVLHKEFLDIVMYSAPLLQSPETHTIGNSIVQWAEIGNRFNIVGNIVKTLYTNELCISVLDFIYQSQKASCLGVLDGIRNFGYIVAHPIEFFENCVGAIKIIGSCIYVGAKECKEIIHLACIDQNKCRMHCAQRKEQLRKIKESVYEALKEYSWPDYVHFAFANATEIILFNGLSKIAQHSFRIANPKLKAVFEKTQYAPSISKNICKEQDLLRIINKSSRKFLPLVKDSVRKQMEEIAIAMKPVYKEIEALKSQFKFYRKGFGDFSNKYIKLDLEHILGIEFKIDKKGLVYNFTGFHHSPKRFYSRSLIIANQKFKSNKVIYADIIFNNNLQKGKTLFPAAWDRKKIVYKIYEAYDYFLETNQVPKLKKGNYWIQGFTKEGIEIEMFISKTGVVKTAYPI